MSEKTSSIPVIMLTILHQEEVGRALGAVDYLIKPLEPQALVETLRRHVPDTTGRVLVVEDDEPTRTLMVRTLRAAGHTVVEAENGQVALDRLAEASPQVIVLDLMMPVMDGMMFLHHLRAMDAYAKVPVIVDAGVGTASDACVAMELGAAGVLMNTGIAGARDPVRMARAMRDAVRAGRPAGRRVCDRRDAARAPRWESALDGGVSARSRGLRSGARRGSRSGTPGRRGSGKPSVSAPGPSRRWRGKAPRRRDRELPR